MADEKPNPIYTLQAGVLHRNGMPMLYLAAVDRREPPELQVLREHIIETLNKAAGT